MPTDAKECWGNNWYCTVYTYKYRGKHVYMYSTSVEHNACDIGKPPCTLLLHVVFQYFSCRRIQCLLFVDSQAHLASHSVLYLEHQFTPPHSVLFPMTAVAPPPHTPVPAQTEATSQPQPSLSVWEAARK